MQKESTVVKKKKVSALDKLNHLLTGESDQLSQVARASLMLKEFQLAKQAMPMYDKLKKEMLEFYVQPPRRLDMANLSEINAAYALAQSYYSRCVTIGMIGEDNYTRWRRIKLLIADYIEEKKAEILCDENVRKVKNSVQEAMIRNKLRKSFRFKTKVESNMNEADSFRKIVDSRKKDLEEVLTTLAKQVKTLALERELTRY